MWPQLSLAAGAHNTTCHCCGFISSMSPASILFCWHCCIPVVNLLTWHKWIYHKLFKCIEDLVSKLLGGLVEGLGLWGKCVNAFCFHYSGMVKRRPFRTTCGGFNDEIPGYNFGMWVILWKKDYFILLYGSTGSLDATARQRESWATPSSVSLLLG